MNKTAIKNFAIWARNKLIADIHYRAGLIGITEEGIDKPLPQSTGNTEFYDIGTSEPYSIHGQAVKQRKLLIELLNNKAAETDYPTAYKYVLEEVAYTWFNRLIAIRFMEVNDYLPAHIRVLSSESGKVEPDLVTTPFDADLEFTEEERATVIQMKQNNQLDELFRMLFIKQCNTLNNILPALFERTSDYTELLLSISVIDKEGVVYHLVNDIPEEDFDVEKGGQVEIIGWLYQYYNTEPKAEVFGRPSGTKIKKEDIPAATQLFTPDWIVRYMVENSLGRLWLEGHPTQRSNFLPTETEQIAYREDHTIQDGKWHYFLEEAEQEPEVQEQLKEIRKEYARLNPENIRCIDPCMGSGHILVYLFDVLMQIYEEQGYASRDAAQSILKNNLYGLDIDDRAAQMAYFAVMMKARQYDRRILTRGIVPHVSAIQESNGINRNQMNYFGVSLNKMEKNTARIQMEGLLDTLVDAKEYGSILQVENYNWNLLQRFVDDVDMGGQISMDVVDLDNTQTRLKELVKIGQWLAQKYDVVVTNPPYMGSSGMSSKLVAFVKKQYPDSKGDLSTVCMKKASRMCVENGFWAMINIPVWMFISSYEKFRTNLLLNQTIINLVHPGRGIFGSDFGTTSFVCANSKLIQYKGIFCRLFVKQGEVHSVEEREKTFLAGENRYIVEQSCFTQIPGNPLAYWVSKKLIDAYQDGIAADRYVAAVGIQTGDNNRFLKCWFEVSISDIMFARNEKYDFTLKWYPHPKGGAFRKWYGNYEYVINWKNNGEDIHSFNKTQISIDKYFRNGICWSHTTSGAFSMRVYDRTSIPNLENPVLFCDGNERKYLLAVYNTKVVNYLLNLLNSTLHYHVGDILRIPIKHIKDSEKVEQLSDICVCLAKEDWDAFELSWDFKRHPLVRGSMPEPIVENILAGKAFENISLSYIYNMFWKNQCNYRFEKLKESEEELNRIFIEIYGLQDELTPEIEDKDITVRKADLKRDIRSLISYAVGCMFGRYSLDTDGLAYAGGDWDKSKYKTFIPDEDGIIPITDEEYLEDDMVARLCNWLKVVYGEATMEENLDFIAKALGNKGDSSREIIRNYFLKDFYKDHCQNYSVTGSGKRPIYWLFDSGKQNGFKALVYLHRYNADTIGNLRVDYLHRMQRVYESEINRMQDMIDNSTNAREVAASTKRKSKLQKQLKECREYDEKIGHLALSRIELDLDDGVKVNYRKIQTARDGKFYEVLADSKNIMGKQR